MTKRIKQIKIAQSLFKEILKKSAGKNSKKAKKIFCLINRYKINGVIIYKDKSKFDCTKNIVTIAHLNARNPKIGNMIQLYYITDYKKLPPTEIAKRGLDKTVCGDCKLRPSNIGGCYVSLFQGVRALQKAYIENSYFNLSNNFDIFLELLKLYNLPIRFGAYGDPTAMEFNKQYEIAKTVNFRVTGYTHQWQNPKFEQFKTFLHASVDNETERNQAIKANWKYYYIVPADLKMIYIKGKNVDYNGAKLELQKIRLKSEIICPNTASKGGLSCANCLKCSGNQGQSIINAIHGSRSYKFVESIREN